MLCFVMNASGYYQSELENAVTTFFFYNLSSLNHVVLGYSR